MSVGFDLGIGEDESYIALCLGRLVVAWTIVFPSGHKSAVG